MTTRPVLLTGDFEPATSERVFRAGVHSLPTDLIAEARAAGLVGKLPAPPKPQPAPAAKPRRKA